MTQCAKQSSLKENRCRTLLKIFCRSWQVWNHHGLMIGTCSYGALWEMYAEWIGCCRQLLMWGQRVSFTCIFFRGNSSLSADDAGVCALFTVTRMTAHILWAKVSQQKIHLSSNRVRDFLDRRSQMWWFPSCLCLFLQWTAFHFIWTTGWTKRDK